MILRRYEKAWKIGCLGLLALGLALAGCYERKDVTAQQQIRIETFEIDANTFLLRPDSKPTIEISGEATVYTMTSDAIIYYTPIGDVQQSLTLELDDIVIERPASGSLTVMRFAV